MISSASRPSAWKVLGAFLAVVALGASGCAGVAHSSADQPPPVANLGAAEVVTNQVYAQRDTGPLALDLYLPPRTAQPTPLVVYVHGGGWEAGDRHLGGDMVGSIEWQTANALIKQGDAVATVDYRLSDVAHAPAQMIDVADGVHWLQSQGARWNLDPGRIVLWGESAGGQIVSELGAVASDPTKPGGGLTGLRGVVDWFGPTDMTADAIAAHPELQDYSRRVVEKFLGCEPSQCPDLAAESSPIKNLSPAMPPFLIQHGTKDTTVPIDQSLDLAQALRELGVPVAMHPYEGLNHGFPRDSPVTPQIVDTVVAFVATNMRDH